MNLKRCPSRLKNNNGEPIAIQTKGFLRIFTQNRELRCSKRQRHLGHHGNRNKFLNGGVDMEWWTE